MFGFVCHLVLLQLGLKLVRATGYRAAIGGVDGALGHVPCIVRELRLIAVGTGPGIHFVHFNLQSLHRFFHF